MQFDVFDCTVIPGGNLFHQVPVKGVTNRELALLRDIHGPQGLTDVVKVGSVDREDRLEYFRLIDKYGSHDDAEATGRMKKRVEVLFGVKLDDFDSWLSGKMEDADDKKEQRDEARRAESDAITAEARRRAEEEMRAKVRAEETERIRQEERAKALEELTAPSSKPAVAEERPQAV